MDEYGNTVHRNHWPIAAAAGIVAFLLFWLSIGWGFLGGLLAGLVVFAILLVVIGLIGSDAPAGETGETIPAGGDRAAPTKASAVVGGTGGAVAATASPLAANPSEASTAAARDHSADEHEADEQQADEQKADEYKSDRRSADGQGPEAGSGDIASAQEIDPADAGSETAMRAGESGDAPAMTQAADPMPADPITDAPIPGAPIPDASEAGAPPDAASRHTAAASPTGPLDESASATADASGSGHPAAAADVGSKPRTLSAPRKGQPDDLLRIRGIGPKLSALCNSLGFWHFDQIAGWSEAEIDWVEGHLEGFKGRVRRDDWVSQACSLASGETTEFSTRVDRGDN